MEDLLRSVHHCAPVKPFVCISMNHADLADEIINLTSLVFPRINDLYKARGSLFSPVLLTIDPKEYENNKPYKDYIIHTYLTNITETAPYFIGILGNNYGLCLPTGTFEDGEDSEFGWYRKNLENAAKYGYKWVLDEDTRYTSLLELGITEAAFRHKSDFSYFYYKDGVNEEISDFPVNEVGNDRVAEKKLKELKQQIIDTDLLVSMFTSPEDLGNLVWRDWTKVLDILYPPLDKRLLTLPMEGFLDNQLSIELMVNHYDKFFLHSKTSENVIISLRKHIDPLVIIDKKEQTFFISQYRDQPQELMVENDLEVKGLAKPIMVLSGSRGSGKTALIANFLTQLKPMNLSCPLFIHFCDGFCGRNILSFIKHIVIRMRYFYKRDRISLFEADYLPSAADLVASFHNCLTFGPCIIVIDGIDYVANSVFSDEYDARNIPWLPSEFPATSRLILTTTDTDHSIKTLGTRKDAQHIHLNAGLSNDQVSTLVSKPLLHPSRSLVVDQLKKINTVNHQGNPLFAVAMANLVGHWSTYGIFDKLLPAVYEPSHIGSLWRSIIQIWMYELGWYLPSSTSDSAQSSSSKRHLASSRAMLVKAQTSNGWVADVLRLLAVSRNGMSETALLACLKEKGYRDDCAVSLLDIKTLRIISRMAIVEDHRGLLKFSHPSLLEAVDKTLLRGLTYPSPQRPVSPFKHDWENIKERFHRLIASYTGSLQCSPQKISELPWHFMMVRDPFALEEVLSEVPCFLSLTSSYNCTNFMADLTEYVKYLEREKFMLDDIVTELLERANMRVDTTHAQGDVDMDYERTSLLQSLILKPETESLTPAEFVCLQYYSGKTLVYFGYRTAAENILLAANKLGYIALDVFDQDLLSRIQLALGEYYLKDGQLDVAKLWLTKAEKTVTDMINTSSIDMHYIAYIRGKIIDCQAYSRILTELPAVTISPKHSRKPRTAGSARSQGTRPASVIRPRLILPDSRLGSSHSSHPRSASSQDYMLIYSTLKSHLELAGKYFERAGSQEGKASMLHHLGILANRCHMPEESEFYLRESISIYREWFGNWHPTLAEVLDDLAVTLASQGRIESNLRMSEAEQLVREGADVKKQACGETNVSTARSYCQLARILVTKRRRDAYREAKELFQRALDILVAKKGFYHPETVSLRKTLFDLHKEVPTHQRRDHSVTFPAVTRKPTTPLRFLKS